MKPILTAALALAVVFLASGRPAPVAAHTHSRTSSTSEDGFALGSWSSDDDAGWFRYALVGADGNVNLVMSDGDLSDRMDHLREAARAAGHRVWWFRLDGRSYLVTDRDVVDRASAIAAPMVELGREMGRLGREQGRWGALQGRLGGLQGRLGALQARLALADAYDRESDADRRANADLERQVRKLEDEVREVAAEQGRLGAKQGELGRRQGELGQQQVAASHRVGDRLEALARESVANGKAERDER